MKKHLLSVSLICIFLIGSQTLSATTEDADNQTNESTIINPNHPVISDQPLLADTSITKTAESPPTTDDGDRPVTYNDVKKIISEVLPSFSGYLQAGYAWNDKNAGDNSTFQMKRMRLFIDKKINNYFDFRAQFEVFSGSTDSQYKKKVMTIMDAYMNAHVNKMVNFRLGQYFTPQGFENNELSPKTLETIDFSSITYNMICRNAISTPNLIDYGRDIGIMMYGDLFENKTKKFSYLSYYLSVTNGNLPTLNDDNKSKDFIGRLLFRPIDKLRISASYNRGEYKRLGEDQVSTGNYLGMDRYIAGAWYYDPNGLSLRSEYGHVESKKAQVREDGLYVLAAYKINKFLPVARWDMYRDHKNEYSPNNKDALLAGVTYEFDKNVKLQFAYTYTIYTDKVKDKTLGTRSNNGNGIQIMCLASF